MYKLLLVCSMILFSNIYIVNAQVSGIPNNLELNGYAWSENIGWISLNCRTGGVGGSDICDVSNYKVEVSRTNGNLRGYAWNSNVGWIRFNLPQPTGFTFPVGNGTVSTAARFTGTYPNNLNMVGWARACAATNSQPDRCNLTDNNATAGGWDGFISLSGTTGSGVAYGVNTASFGSAQYVWGSAVIGWIDMSTHVSFYAPASITGTGCTIPDGQSTCTGQLTWNFTEGGSLSVRQTAPISGVVSTNIQGSNENVTLTRTASGGGNSFALFQTTELPGANVTLQANCEAGSTFVGGVCQTATVTAPIITISANPRLTRRGGQVVISWTTDPNPILDGSCSLTGPDIISQVDVVGNGSHTVTVNNTSFYTINCTGPFSFTPVRATVNVLPGMIEI